MVFALQSSSVVMNPIVSFIEPPEVHRSNEQSPSPTGEGLEADGERRQDVGDIDPALVPPNAAVGRDAPDLEVLGVRDRSQPRHVQSIRRGIERCRSALVQRLVGPHLVEGMSEGIEAPLLGAERGRRRPGGVGLQVPMHPLVASILMRAGGLDELGAHAEPEPPDAELGEAAEGAGSKGLPIIGANPLGQSVLPKESAKDLLGRLE